MKAELLHKHTGLKKALLIGAAADALTTTIGIYGVHIPEGNGYASNIIQHYETTGILAIKTLSMVGALGIATLLEKRQENALLKLKKSRFDSAQVALSIGNIAQWGAVALNVAQIGMSI